jgi:hypothetical protein
MRSWNGFNERNVFFKKVKGINRWGSKKSIFDPAYLRCFTGTAHIENTVKAPRKTTSTVVAGWLTGSKKGRI